MFTLLFAMRDCLRSRAGLRAEILALRHQVLIFERSRRRHNLPLRWTDRALWVWLSRLKNMVGPCGLEPQTSTVSIYRSLVLKDNLQDRGDCQSSRKSYKTYQPVGWKSENRVSGSAIPHEAPVLLAHR
jgi:hypothetical protein